jgi:hypothetical protein
LINLYSYICFLHLWVVATLTLLPIAFITIRACTWHYSSLLLASISDENASNNFPRPADTGRDKTANAVKSV